MALERSQLEVLSYDLAFPQNPILLIHANLTFIYARTGHHLWLLLSLDSDLKDGLNLTLPGEVLLHTFTTSHVLLLLDIVNQVLKVFLELVDKLMQPHRNSRVLHSFSDVGHHWNIEAKEHGSNLLSLF